MLDSQQRLVIADNDESAGDVSYYRFARVTVGGALDETFNGNAQSPDFPGLASLSLGTSSYFDGLDYALPLADGHILGIGDVGPVAEGDGAYDLALVRLADDAALDAAFGDAV